MSIRKSTLVEHVADELRQMILTQAVRPGGYFPPRKELAAHFGVGLSTVHEAIQGLTAMGMLESRPGKGTWVRPDALETLIHPTTVRRRLGELEAQHICEARSVLEVALTELAAQRATPADIQRMNAALQAMEAHLENDDAFVKADWEFHLAVAAASHSVLLEQLYHLAHKLLAEITTELIKLPQVKENGLRIQWKIARAIEQGDPEQARKAAADHMVVINQLLCQ